MDILFRQSRERMPCENALFEVYGIENCLVKHLCLDKDRAYITRKRHYHQSFEVHLIETGFQVYETDGGVFRLDAGQTLLIPPHVMHGTLQEDAHTVKHALTFTVAEGGLLAEAADKLTAPLVLETPPVIIKSIQKIHAELADGEAYSSSVIALCAWECVLSLFRRIGLSESRALCTGETAENERFLLAQQYVSDNVRRPISVAELASYVCISKKQLERIFLKEAGVSVMAYVRQKRCAEIERLLASSASLREISEMMSFSSEYYFNAYFKKHVGMTPGTYRKTIKR